MITTARKKDESELESSEDEEEEELAMIAKRFKRFMNKKKNKYIDLRKNQPKKEKEVTYYHCKKSDHIKPNSPLIKKTTISLLEFSISHLNITTKLYNLP